VSPLGRPQSDHAPRRLIDAYLLDELDEPSARRLAEHVRDCPSCAAELGGTTRLIELLRTLPEPQPSADLDARIISAALADRRLRIERRPWYSGLPGQVFRGAMRTTGTVVATVVAVALIGAAFVFAASSFILPVPTSPDDTARATVPPVATPTFAPTEPVRSAVPTVVPTEGAFLTPAPVVVSPTIRPTAAPTQAIIPTQAPTARPLPTEVPTASPEATETPAPTVTSPEPTVTPEPSATASPEPTPLPTAQPTVTPEPTPEPTGTPEPSATASPSPSATASPSPTPSPTASPTEQPSASPDPSATPKPRRTPPPSAVPSSAGGSPSASPEGGAVPSP
jgi:anti-sigma factor RsiW